MCVTFNDCVIQRKKLMDIYYQYRSHIATFHSLRNCRVGGVFSPVISLLPGMRSSTLCHEGDPETRLRNEQEMIENLEGSLFIHGRLP